VNRACVFGTLARFGSGEWAYLATPIGIYVASLLVAFGFTPMAKGELTTGSPILAIALWFAVPFFAFALWRLARPLIARRAESVGASFTERLRHALATRVWAPHSATTVIGITFLFMFVLVGAWDYTGVLAELANGMTHGLLSKVLLLVALFAGAALAGYTAGRFRHTRISLRQLARCFAGGFLMGVGGLIVPGHNDGLILVGMPLLWPYAWIAFAMMCVSIAAALLIERIANGVTAEKHGS